MVTDSRGMAKILNKFFSSVFTEEGQEPVPEGAGNHAYAEKLCNIEFTVKDIRDLIKKLKTSGAAGPDQISARILQELAWDIAPALTILFRTSLAEGIDRMTGGKQMSPPSSRKAQNPILGTTGQSP